MVTNDSKKILIRSRNGFKFNVVYDNSNNK